MKTQDIKNIARAMQQVQEKLKGDQHKLDHDKDGDIDAADFKHMRKKKKSDKDDVEMNPKKGNDQATSEVGEAASKQVDEISRSMTPMKNKFGGTVIPKKFDAYKKHMKTHKLDEPTVRMIHQNPDEAESKRMMKNPKYAKAVDMYKAAHKNESVDEAKKYLDQKDIKKALASIKPPKKKPTLPKAPWDKEDKMKEDTALWPVYSRILENRAAHYKGAAAPETSDDKLKGAGAKKMKADFAGNAADPDLEKKGHDDAAKAGRAGPNGKKRSNDNSNGDKVMQKLAAAYGKVVSENKDGLD